MVTLKELGYNVDSETHFNSVCVNCEYYDSGSCTITDTKINPLGTCDKQVSIQRVDAVEPMQINGSILTDSEYETLSQISAADFVEIAEAALNE
ncbi:MAG: hypothetical protein KME47_09480 [Nodosilinea sp. WJT8-NPBG4]|jgi:hypothetical protein|nr:hypothetical protein [Nodosilinea sp. WJT8-NPBG4]